MTVLDSVFEGNVCRGDQVCTRSDMCGEAHGGALYAGGVSKTVLIMINGLLGWRGSLRRGGKFTSKM
jgi:hypothetical protein